MMNSRNVVIMLVLLLASASVASSQVPRTFVSALGNDSNPCSRVAPCRTFTRAMSQTNTGGEVVVIDSGSFEALAITKSISLIAPPGVDAGISVSAANGIIVAASPDDVIYLRGLTLNSQGGTVGVRLLSAKELHLQHCAITGFHNPNGGSAGIHCTGSYSLFVEDTLVNGNQIGILAGGNSSGASISIDRCRIEGNADNGLSIIEGAKASVRDTVASGNPICFGAYSADPSQPAELNIERCLIANNGTGVRVDGYNGATPIIRISNSTVTNNNLSGLVQVGSGVLLSRLNNTVEGNTPTDTVGTISQYVAK